LLDVQQSEERRKARRRQRKEDERKAREAEADQPLYKRLRAGDTVDVSLSIPDEACYRGVWLAKPGRESLHVARSAPLHRQNVYKIDVT
jgi:hypothetical protein